jgi:CAAX prenyl protease-like protein
MSQPPADESGAIPSRSPSSSSKPGGHLHEDDAPELRGLATFSDRNPWAVFVLPYAVFILGGSLEPPAGEAVTLLGWTFPWATYPIVYTLKIALVICTMAWLSRGYRQFPFRLLPLALGTGAVGGVIWIGLSRLQAERSIIDALGLGEWANYGARTGYDPLTHFADRPLVAYGFLAVRFVGLALVVPVIEEFLLRGFVMRFVQKAEWWEVPFGTLSAGAVAAGTILPVLTHPVTELLAVVTWFSLGTWLMWRTRNIWDCVAAHAVTNFMLGVWVVASGDWHLM